MGAVGWIVLRCPAFIAKATGGATAGADAGDPVNAKALGAAGAGAAADGRPGAMATAPGAAAAAAGPAAVPDTVGAAPALVSERSAESASGLPLARAVAGTGGALAFSAAAFTDAGDALGEFAGAAAGTVGLGVVGAKATVRECSCGIM